VLPGVFVKLVMPNKRKNDKWAKERHIVYEVTEYPLF
jgi:hypothetical protein